MTPLVLTVIIPVYKTAATLDRCVESVLSQAAGCELILVDDGSPDACGDLCDRWAERSDRISVVHQPNRGLSAARNSGIARSHAPYVTFVDSDDVLQPHTLPPLLALLAAHPDYDLVEYPVEIHYGSPRCHQLALADSVYTDWRRYWLDARAYTHTYACNKVFRRSLFDHCLFPEGLTFEDAWLLPRLLPHCRAIATVTTGLYRYYDNPQGITRTATGADLSLLLAAHCYVLPLVSNADYYAHVVNVALDVYHATGRVPSLPRLPYWYTPKLLINRLLGFRFLCRLHQLLRPRH